MKIKVTDNKFSKQPTYKVPLLQNSETDIWFENLNKMMDLFDQNGFDLTAIEKLYAKKNQWRIKGHRSNHSVIRETWFTDEEKSVEGCHINHAVIFERKGFEGAALEQLEKWSEKCPLLQKLIQMKPKWGLDFSIDYADKNGNVFEVLHWEWDSFDYQEIADKKKYMEEFLVTINFDEQAQRLLDYKSEWHHLEFFEQSEYKTKFFGIEKEKFKQVLWK